MLYNNIPVETSTQPTSPNRNNVHRYCDYVNTLIYWTAGLYCYLSDYFGYWITAYIINYCIPNIIQRINHNVYYETRLCNTIAIAILSCVCIGYNLYNNTMDGYTIAGCCFLLYYVVRLIGLRIATGIWRPSLSN